MIASDLKAELHRVAVQPHDDLETLDILDMVLMQLEEETISDEEYAENLAIYEEMNAGKFVSRDELRAKYALP